MIPDNALFIDIDEEFLPADISTSFYGGRSLAVKDELDYETGGVALNDPSHGHLVQVWKTEVSEDKTEIYISAENTSVSTIYTGTNITEVSLSFDQNMRPALAFVENGSAKLRWYDSNVNQQVVTNFGTGIITPRVSLDDKREHQTNRSDVIFAYVKDGHLYFRQQRDRYGTEYLLKENVGGNGLIKIGMNIKYRFQFLIRH